MQLKSVVNYRIDHHSGWLTASAFFAGLSIFAIALYYFVLTDFSAMGTGSLILQVILPLLWFVSYVVLLKGVQLKLPVVYGAMGAVYCLLMIIWGFLEPTVLGSVGGTVFYLLAGAALVATTLGFIPGKYILATAFGAVVLIQLFWKDLALYVLSLELKAYLPMLSRISGVAALSLLCFGLKPRPLRRK